MTNAKNSRPSQQRRYVKSERQVHLAVAVGAEVGLVQPTDRRGQLLVADRAWRPVAAATLIVRRPGFPERAADELDGEAKLLLGVDEGAHLRGVPSSSFAKYTLAARRISFAWRSSRTSPRKRLSSSRSALERTDGVPPAASALAWRTHVRSASLCTPRSCATCAIGRPDSSANRVARSRNSSLYFFGAAIRQTPFLSPGRNPGLKVSVNPSLPQRAISPRRCASSRAIASSWAPCWGSSRPAGCARCCPRERPVTPRSRRP